MLEKFLKFTTGSSRLPYESHYWKIEVNFRKAADVKSLPIAHTCSKELEVYFIIKIKIFIDSDVQIL